MTLDYTPTPANDILMQRACASIPGGVNSPVRAFKAVGGTPRFISRAEGAYIWDADGKRYTDYIGSWGPMILGHLHPQVLEAVEAALHRGFTFGAPTEQEVELAETVIGIMPSIDMLRLVNSGTEACMSAIRLARGATGRRKIIKFEGCYHGHADALLVKAGSGLATLNCPSSAGVPENVVQDTVVLEFNNTEQLERAFAEYGSDIACLILEPIAGNMNFVRARQPFIDRCRELCTQHGGLLILDEVMTGFRVALGGAQSLYGITPDLTVLGKVIGGGMPLAAFGGRRDVMEQLAPLGGVYQAGTLSGNPIATACGIATLQCIQREGFYEELQNRASRMLGGMAEAAQRHGVPFAHDCQGGMFGFFLLDALPGNYQTVMQSDAAQFNRFFHGMLERGVYFAPALYEAGFISAQHTDEDIEATIAAAEAVFAALAATRPPAAD